MTYALSSSVGVPLSTTAQSLLLLILHILLLSLVEVCTNDKLGDILTKLTD